MLKAAQDAISSSLLEVSIDSATGVLFNVTGPMDLGLAEVRWGGLLVGVCQEFRIPWQVVIWHTEAVAAGQSRVCGA